VVRVLQRRIARWQRAAEAEPDAIAAQAAAARAEIPAILARLRDAGAVNDASFAAAKVRRLSRLGRSRRVIEGHLAARGVLGEVRDRAIAEHATDDLLGALLTARRRRLGPFRTEAGPDNAANKDMAALSRAGFPENIVRQVMQLSHADAVRIVERATGAQR
jgi:regulatory protein